MDEPFLRMDDPRLPEILTDATWEVLARWGLTEWSVAALAQGSADFDTLVPSARPP